MSKIGSRNTKKKSLFHLKHSSARSGLVYIFSPVNLLELTEGQRTLFIALGAKSSIFFEKLKDGEHLLAFAAFEEEKPVGLIFGYAYPLIEQGFIRSIFVAPEHRRQGIGKRLLSALTECFQAHNIQLLEWKFNSWEKEIEPFKALLKRAGWSQPSIFVERYLFASETFSPSWFEAADPVLPKQYKIFLWKYLNPKSAEKIRRLVQPNSVLADLSPFDDIYPLETLNSLGLRRGKEVVGWMITHRISEDTIRYSALYIHPELRGIGPAIALLKESIRRHIKSKVKYGLTEINLKRTPKYWIQFVKKRLAPSAIRIDYVLLSFLVLKKD